MLFMHLLMQMVIIIWWAACSVLLPAINGGWMRLLEPKIMQLSRKPLRSWARIMYFSCRISWENALLITIRMQEEPSSAWLWTPPEPIWPRRYWKVWHLPWEILWKWQNPLVFTLREPRSAAAGQRVRSGERWLPISWTWRWTWSRARKVRPLAAPCWQP